MSAHRIFVHPTRALALCAALALTAFPQQDRARLEGVVRDYSSPCG